MKRGDVTSRMFSLMLLTTHMLNPTPAVFSEYPRTWMTSNSNDSRTGRQSQNDA